MRTYIIRAFIPWLIYLAFADGSVAGLRLATLGGLLLLFIFNWRALRQKFLFDWASAIFFFCAWLSSIEFQTGWVAQNSLLLGYLFLSFVSFLSLLLRVPVALQHAKSKVSVIFWNHPIFIGMNFWLTTIWGGLFMLAALSLVLFDLGVGSKTLMVSSIPVALVVIGILFTTFFPDAYKERIMCPGTVAALDGLSPIRMVKVGKSHLAYRLIGEGPLLMLLPDARMNMHHWDPDFLRYLSRDFQVLIVDYPGVGYSESQEMLYTADHIADYLAEMISVDKLDVSMVVGYGLGGFIAQSLLSRHQEIASKLVLIASSAGGELSETAEWLPTSLPKRLQEKFHIIDQGASIEGALGQTELEKEHGLWTRWMNEQNAKKRLAKIVVPTLIVSGKEDDVISVKNSERLHQHLKGSDLALYEQSGHAIIYEYPREIADKLKGIKS